MSATSDILDAPLLHAGYPGLAGVYDEMSLPSGKIRPHWKRLVKAFSELGAEGLGARWQTARQRIRENGVTYNVYGDPLGMDRPWSLDAIPLLIPGDEWARLEEGLIQRARLLNWILADLYGRQSLLHAGHLPPALVFGNPGFWRPCHSLPVKDNQYLQLLAVDLARSADGQWWVLSDRTQSPSGAGYALENRIVLAETYPELVRELKVHRIASFFRAFRDNLLHLSPAQNEHPRAVLLTPGPYNETYFEHSYLARYLGFPLVHSGDLTVRDSRVFLKTLEGLKPVDVILRRVDDGFCDPIELRSNSFLGVAGLVEAVRAGNVAVANALGSGLIETSAFMPFLPGLSRRVLGEELKLKSVATWWCGQPHALQYVRDNLDFLVIKPAFPSKAMEPVFGGKLPVEERARLLDRIAERPHDYAGQELLNLSSAPVWSHKELAPRRVVLRVFLAAAGDSWVVMPGGLARVSASMDTPVVSMQRGGGSKDTWILSRGPVDQFTMQRPRHLPVELKHGATTDLPSSAADNVFWLGRYTERCEHMARVLRCILQRLTGESGASGPAEWESLMKLHASLQSPHARLSKDDAQGHLDQTAEFEQEILSLIFDDHRRDSLTTNLHRAGRAAANVRDRLSTDLLRIVSQFGSVARAAKNEAWGYIAPGEALAVLNHCIVTLAAFRGIEMENMTRGPGWHFLSLGRRIERSVHLVDLLGALILPTAPQLWPTLEMLLEVADSSMTYRSRYFTILQHAPVLDLLMNDEGNPRSLAFQIRDIGEHSKALATLPSGSVWPVAQQTTLEEAAFRLFRADPYDLCSPDEESLRKGFEEQLAATSDALLAFSNAVTLAYFSHAEFERAS
jgi:uncharacterized circularly permuted ATP-grasp superfamily protein/uncharacterized alpha-E superfamily protein